MDSRIRSGCRTLIPVVLLLVLPACGERSGPDEHTGRAAADTARAVDDVRSIREVLSMQEAAWNAGDIEAFMEGYVRTDSLRFVSGGTVRYGWQRTLDRYHQAYPDRAAMGHLTFSDVKIDLLGADAASVFGRWSLARSGDYDDIGGLYSLLCRRIDGRWLIVADHTSSDDN